MSDFLRHLAARSLGLSPVVRPRLTSRFATPATEPRRMHDDDFLVVSTPYEPAADGGPLIEEGGVEALVANVPLRGSLQAHAMSSSVEAEDAVPDRADPRQVSTVTTHDNDDRDIAPDRSDHALPSLSASVVPRSIASSSLVATDSQIPRQQHAPIKTTGEPMPETTPWNLHEHSPGSSPERTAQVARNEVVSPAIPTTQSAIDAMPPRAHNASSDTMPTTRLEPGDAKPLANTSARSTLATQAASAGPVSATRTAATRHRRIEATATQHSPTPTGPTIHVSIGRVEIRAHAQPAAPTPRSRRDERSPTSLENYLHRQSSGGKP
ncbi:hypothetical protein [Paraburkholderia sp. BCC1886]|uniref:hypothetical protein n=1 Tax=Paraburkholderia sp. BCC1886 TaxID=2562670 RepID=UPI00118449E1|nr:hypothetical protein [Paraburkholderia sp. BCC1886]